MANTKDLAEGALGPNWKGTLVIEEALANGVSQLSKLMAT